MFLKSAAVPVRVCIFIDADPSNAAWRYVDYSESLVRIAKKKS